MWSAKIRSIFSYFSYQARNSSVDEIGERYRPNHAIAL